MIYKDKFHNCSIIFYLKMKKAVDTPQLKILNIIKTDFILTLGYSNSAVLYHIVLINSTTNKGINTPNFLKLILN